MKIISTQHPDVIIIAPKLFLDERGHFLQSYQSSDYQAVGIHLPFVQDNLSRSKNNILRGLHYQLPHAQGKLVMVTAGSVFDVAIDLRYGSPHFGQAVWAILDDQHYHQLYIPPGFAHGFCVLSAQADFLYKCTDYYHPAAEKGLLWNDPELQIPWPVEQPIVAAKDQSYPRLRDIPSSDLPIY